MQHTIIFSTILQLCMWKKKQFFLACNYQTWYERHETTKRYIKHHHQQQRWLPRNDKVEKCTTEMPIKWNVWNEQTWHIKNHKIMIWTKNKTRATIKACTWIFHFIWCNVYNWWLLLYMRITKNTVYVAFNKQFSRKVSLWNRVIILMLHYMHSTQRNSITREIFWLLFSLGRYSFF